MGIGKAEVRHLKALLVEHAVRVTFTKTDGTTRVMYCTQNLEYVPEEKMPAAREVQKMKPVSLIVVWDLVAKDWRSFNDHQVVEYERSEASMDEIVESVG